MAVSTVLALLVAALGGVAVANHVRPKPVLKTVRVRADRPRRHR